MDNILVQEKIGNKDDEVLHLKVFQVCGIIYSIKIEVEVVEGNDQISVVVHIQIKKVKLVIKIHITYNVVEIIEEVNLSI